jgi:Tol biopolymer transport system component
MLRTSSSRAHLTLALTLVLGALAAGAAAAAPTTKLVSRQGKAAGGLAGDDSSSDPSISANGRFVAFSTAADNLGGPIDTDVDNVYVYDRKLKKVQLISRRSRGAGGAGGNDQSFLPVISASGRFVAFETAADNLGGPLDTDVTNVYVYDRERKKVELVSRRSRGAGGAGADGPSAIPAISANGRYVAFQTSADNLGGPVDTGVENVYVYDRKRDKAQLISRRAGGAGGDGNSANPSLSGSGRLVAFQTDADNLGGPVDDSVQNVYVYDRERRKVQLVSRRSQGAGGEGADDSSGSPGISASGRLVAFETDADNLGGPAEDVGNIYVYDRERKRVQLVSRRSQGVGGAGAEDDSDDPVLSADGRFVAFETDADNLGGPPNPANTADDAYVYDRKRKRVELVGRASGKNGEGCDEDCDDTSISASGRFVALEVFADNLGGPGVLDGSNDVYVRDRGR